jgi:hypothetical protein
MNDNIDWEDVFRQAAGENIDEGTALVAESVASVAQRKGRKRSKYSFHRDDDANVPLLRLHASFLRSSRPVSLKYMNNKESKQIFTQFHSCSDYRCLLSVANDLDNMRNDTHDNSRNRNQLYSTAPCTRCAQPSGMHQMKYDLSCRTPQDTVFGLFVTIRNIRCSCRMELVMFSQLAFTANDIEVDESRYFAFHPNVLSDLLLELQRLQSEAGTDHLTDGLLCNVTLRYLDCLVQHVQQMTVAAELNDDARRRKCIECIMKCDEVYYRMYYNCLVSQPRPTAPESKSPPKAQIPPPLAYFSEWLQVDQQQTIGSNSIVENPTEIATPDSQENPLFRLYQFRSIETTAIFGKEWFHQSAHGPTAKSGDYRPSSCTFQSLFLEWNRSCRDFLCHVYCYATLSNSLMRQVLTKLQHDYQCTNIIEMGAGTGYLAHWLSTVCSLDTPGIPVHVFAYDVAPNPPALVEAKWKSKQNPSSVVNEYHADMAGYYFPVLYGDCHSVSSFVIPTSPTGTTALLLCYPPPDSSMAYDALRNYCLHTRKSASCPLLIHIGEFKGLTGSLEFEEYLLNHFTCVERWPCRTWGGIDAATVTIWTGHHASLFKSSRSLLLPCAQCHEKESIRRCQFLRSVVYCSLDCYRAHCDKMMSQQDERCRLLRDDANEMLDFENESHFAVLR